MASMQEEMEDSRISAVGRKRNLRETQDEEVSSRHSSPEDDVQRASKRVKEDDEPLVDSIVEDGIIHTLSPVASPSPPTAISQPPPAGAAPPGAAWNRGVQSGLRTSFGSRAQYHPKSKSVTPIFHDRNESVVGDQPQSKSVISNPPKHDQAGLASAAEGRRLYIGNLAYAATEEDLQSFFRGYLIESTSMPKSPRTDRLIGYAFVDLPTPSEAEQAITELSGKEVLDHKVSVQLARKTEPNGEKGEGAASGSEASSEGGHRQRKRTSRRVRGRGGQDADSPYEINPAGMRTPQMPMSNTSNQAEEGDIPMAETMEAAENQTITTTEQDEASENSYSEKLSLPQMEMAFPSEAEEGEILSSRESGDDMNVLHKLTSGSFGQYVGDETSFSKGGVDNTDALHQQTPHLRGRDERLSAGNAFGVDLQPRENFEQRPSSNTSAADDMEVNRKLKGKAFKVLSDAELAQLTVAEKPKYMKAHNDYLSKQQQLIALSDKTESFNRLTAEAEAAFAQEGIPLPRKYNSVKKNVSSGLTFFPRKINKNPVYSNNKIECTLSEVLCRGKPIRIQDLSFEIFAPALLKQNPSGWDHINLKVLVGAFNLYRFTFYSIAALEAAGISKANVESPYITNSIAIDEAKRRAKLLQNMPLMNDQYVASSNQDEIPDNQDEDPDNQNEVPEQVQVEIDIDSAEVNALERELLRKYFPATIDRPATYRCLACGDNFHTTVDCPSVTCVLCGGGHAQFTCPENRRCDKCRQRGHQSFDCPEKLALSKAEAIGCDFCDSTGHVEVECHSIWRTFNPKSEEIRKVRDIPVHCYICGGTGHYGPECGLYRRGPILSGGETWSQANLLKYIDATSADRAISAGIDYSIASRPTKDFTIKGKANNPIELDDSDDGEPIFLHKKIKGPKAQHQMRIAKTFPRASNPPKESRPGFGRNNFRDNPPPGVDSARYGRGRTFSPPPRFDDVRHNFPEADDHFRPQVPQREDSYRPRQPLAQDSYQPAPQGSLPVRTISMGLSNAPRGGHGGRGGRAQNGIGKSAQGGNNNQSGGTKGREKRRKRAERGGGAAGKGKGK